MFCPLLRSAQIISMCLSNDNMVIKDSIAECDKENCAWHDTDWSGNCSVLEISNNIVNILDFMRNGKEE